MSDLRPLSDIADTDYAVVLYYEDVQVEVAPNEVRFRRSPESNKGDAGEVLTSFGNDVFSDIVHAFEAVPS